MNGRRRIDSDAVCSLFGTKEANSCVLYPHVMASHVGLAFPFFRHRRTCRLLPEHVPETDVAVALAVRYAPRSPFSSASFPRLLSSSSSHLLPLHLITQPFNPTSSHSHFQPFHPSTPASLRVLHRSLICSDQLILLCSCLARVPRTASGSFRGGILEPAPIAYVTSIQNHHPFSSFVVKWARTHYCLNG